MSVKDDLAYLWSIRVYIGLAVLFFAFSAALGYVEAGLNSQVAEEWMAQLDMLKWITELPPVLIMVVIFLKNFLACAMSVLMGLGLGIVPFLVVTSNGFLLGIVSYETIQKAGVLYLMAGILPHGIIELPVVLLSIAVGFRLGYLVALSIISERTDLTGETRTAVHLLLFRFMPLLLLAAFIETFITPLAISVVA